MNGRLLFVVNDAGFFVSHRLPLALAARAEGFEIHVATADGAATRLIESHDIVHHRLRLSRGGTNLLREWLTFVDIVRVIRRVRPDVLHLVTLKPVIYGGIAARFMKVPAVVAAISGLGHVFVAHDARTRLVRALVTVAYRLALNTPRVSGVFQNGSDRDVLEKIGAVQRDRTVLIRGSGVDLSQYRPSPEPAGIPVVVFAARLLAAKGVHEFVEAARLLRSSGMEARFLLVGDADPSNAGSVTYDDIARWRSEGSVDVLGHRDDIAAIFAACNLVVLPSYYGEGLPKVLVEAAASGRAVVTTDMPGCREAIDPGETGVLVPARDAGALAQAIRELLTNSTARRLMGQAGRRLAEREYAIEHIAAQHLEIYRGRISR